jgi:hypothetical protein
LDICCAEERVILLGREVPRCVVVETAVDQTADRAT